jgi:phosphoserine phosphatase RsbU/P
MISDCTIPVHGPEAGAPPCDLPAGASGVFRHVSEIVPETTSAPSPIAGGDALRRYAARLKLLNEVHQALGRSIGLDELLELILDRAFEHLGPERGAIFLKQPGGELRRAASRPGASPWDELPCFRSLTREVAEKGLAALVYDVHTDRRFAGSDSMLLSGIKSLIAAPLLGPEGSLGMIVLDSRIAVRHFTEEDMELLVSLASVAALHLRNASLAQEAAERRRLEEELALARRIQLALLPERLPELPGYEFHGLTVPSRGVSGDYFEVCERRGGEECVLLVADVAGKGMGASLLAASLEALAAEPLADGLPPEEICARLSRQLYRRTPPEKYATLFLAALEPASGALRYANAGHNPPLLVRATGEVERLEATGVPIGLLPDLPYGAAVAQLEPGDTLVLYTDGLAEAADPEGEEYGAERLAECCLRHGTESCAALAAALSADLKTFARGVPCADDLTLVLARRLSG